MKSIVPALNSVGVKFEKGIVFLPQLIASAETVQKSFAMDQRSINEE